MARGELLGGLPPEDAVDEELLGRGQGEVLDEVERGRSGGEGGEDGEGLAGLAGEGVTPGGASCPAPAARELEEGKRFGHV